MKKSLLILGHTALAQSLKNEGFQVYTAGSMETAKSAYDLYYNSPVFLNKILEDLQAKATSIDYIFYHDDGNLPWVLGLENRTIPAFYYSVDTFCNPWHIPFSRIFEHTFVAQKDFLPLFLEQNPHTSWFPLFCNSNLIANFKEEDFLNRSIPVSFVGTIKPKNIPQREAFLNSFKQLCPLVIKQGNYQPVFLNSQIVLNQSAAQEINYRVFEATALGAALLNENINHGLYSLFTPTKDILPCYEINKSAMAAEIALYYLNNPSKLSEIAYNGWYKTKNLHSDIQRTKKIAKLFSHINTSPPTKELMDKRQQDLKNTFQILACDLQNTLPLHAAFYLEYANN